VLVFFMIRNNRKRKRDAEEMANKLVPGAKVMTSFGLYGKLISRDAVNNTAEVEIAPKVIVTMHSQAVARVVEGPVETVAAAPVAKPAAAQSADAKPAYGLRSEAAAPAAKKPAVKKPAAKPATKTAAKPAAKTAAKPAAKKPAAKKPSA